MNPRSHVNLNLAKQERNADMMEVRLDAKVLNKADTVDTQSLMRVYVGWQQTVAPPLLHPAYSRGGGWTSLDMRTCLAHGHFGPSHPQPTLGTHTHTQNTETLPP